MNRYTQKLMTMIEFGDALAKLSTDPRIQVGCVIFPEDFTQVYSIGYNGAARGLPHVEPSDGLATPQGSGFAHAEANALVKFSPALAKPSTMYVTHAPCSRCAPLIVNSERISSVIYRHAYLADEAGLRILKAADMHVYRVEDIHA